MRSRKLRAKALLEEQIDPVFSRVDEGVSRRASMRYPMRDILMAGLAMFTFKNPSLHRFERDTRDGGSLRHNVRLLYGVREVPTDEAIRQRLDKAPPEQVGRAFKQLLSAARRVGVLDRHFKAFKNHCVLAVDGTGVYSSTKGGCERCCVKKRRGGDERYHQMVMGALVHPDHGHVLIPTAPEFVSKQDGSDKNDCELNAFKRWIVRYRREHPHLKTIVVADALYCNGAVIELLRELDLRYVIVSKKSDRAELFRQFRTHCRGEVADDVRTDGESTGRRVRWSRRLPLTQQDGAPRVNMAVTRETPAGKEEETQWAFVTDLETTRESAAAISWLGRSRWRIENEVYRTLKTATGLDHNYGHGKRHLMENLVQLMLIAFFNDQLQRIGSEEFQAALAAKDQRLSYLWDAMRNVLHLYRVDGWSTLYGCIANPPAISITRESLADPPG